jgi:hypothetical protein
MRYYESFWDRKLLLSFLKVLYGSEQQKIDAVVAGLVLDKDAAAPANAMKKEIERGLGRHFARELKAAGEEFWRVPLALEIQQSCKLRFATIRSHNEPRGNSLGLAIQKDIGLRPLTWIDCPHCGPAPNLRARFRRIA